MEPTPTAALDRHNDRVYDSTTSVVRAVMALSQGVQAHHANLYLDLVKKVSRSFTIVTISAPKICIRRFVITEKAPTRASPG